MSYHDYAKPLIGTSLLVLYLPVPFYLACLHGLHRLWRRVGVASQAFLLLAYVLMIAVIVRFHSLWAWHAWEWPDALGWIAVVPLAFAGWLAIETYRTIEPKTLHLVHQIRPNGERRLITNGILGRMRHPRYVMFSLMAMANVFITGYPLILGALAVTLLLFSIVIRLEERELEATFGASFEEYRKRVPAFFPGRRRG